MKKKILKSLLLIILFFLPFCVFITVAELTPDQYGNTYLAELNDKYENLKNEKEKKVIFVGGSSLPFGLRSDLIEQELKDYRVINFGLYATLGTKLMMELSTVNIQAGDIVVLSPELNAQTYSLYFNANALLQACDGFSSMDRHLTTSEKMSLFYNYYKYAASKVKYSATKSTPDPTGIYRHDSFNEYGDIKVDRPYNVMNNSVDTNVDVYTDETLLNDEFLDYVNEYCNFVRKCKAKIYFSFSPTNELAVKSSKNMRKRFINELNSRLECDLLLDIEDCIMDSGYFYDTNFHLNSSGAIYYSSIIVKALNNKLNVSVSTPSNGCEDGNEEVKNPENGDESENTDDKPSNGGNNNSGNIGGITIVPPPEKPGNVDVPVIVPGTDKVSFEKYNGEPNVDYVDYFSYKLVGEMYEIIGLNEEYKDTEELIVPSVYDGKLVTSIGKDAFKNCIALKRLHIGETFTNIDDAFYGCISLERIYLYNTDGDNISVKNTLLNGANRNVKIYIPQGANYVGGYRWNNFNNKFVYFIKEVAN